MKKIGGGVVMGGYGSGQKWNSKTAVEECKSIDINYLNRQNVLDGRPHNISWNNSQGKELGNINVMAIDGYLRLFYTVDQEKKLDYKIKIEKVPMNFGGYKKYFRCKKCNRRVEKIYLSNKSNYFLCRHCLDLTYRSCQQSRDKAAKIRRKLRKLYSKLGSKWKGAAYSRIPDRPKNMHHETYEEIKDKIMQYEIELDRMLAEKMQKLKNVFE